MSDENRQIDPIEQHVTESVANCPGLKLITGERTKLAAEVADLQDRGYKQEVIDKLVKERIEEIENKLIDVYANEAAKASEELAGYDEAFIRERDKDKNVPKRQLIRDRLRDKYQGMSTEEFENTINNYNTYANLSDSEELAIIKSECGRRGIQPTKKAQEGIKKNGFDRWIIGHSEKAARTFAKLNFYSQAERGAFKLLWDGGKVSAHSVEDFIKDGVRRKK